MEGYQNYQAIIDAIKSEYVNARNLKKSANSKKERLEMRHLLTLEKKQNLLY